MTKPATDAIAEAQVRQLIDSWAAAAQKGDVDAITAHYAPDIRAFDAIQELQFEGVDAYRAHWQACMEFCPSDMIFELHDLQVAASGDIAFASGLSRCGGTGPDGEKKSSWMRFSAGYRRIGDAWKVVHEHFSAPFDMESGKALFDLQP